MFYVKGWVTLSQISRIILIRNHRYHFNNIVKGNTTEVPADLDDKLMVEESSKIWEICEAAEEVGILLASGNVINAEKRLVARGGAVSFNNRHLNLFTGTVGSSDFNNDPVKPLGMDELQRRYGMFLGLPVLLPAVCKEEAEKFRSIEIEGDVGTNYEFLAGFDERDLVKSPEKISESIIQSYDSGVKLTKKDYRKLLAPNLSVRAFELAWRLATAQRAVLSSPGRRSRR